MKVNENSCEGWRRAGKRPLPEAGASRRRVCKLRPLQQTLSFHVDQMARMKEIKEYFGM